MSRIYRRRKTDSTQAAIVEGLEKCGYIVHVVHEPVDLLVGRPGWGNLWCLLECKPPTGKSQKARIRADQPEQNEFCERQRVPRVTNFVEARMALVSWWQNIQRSA